MATINAQGLARRSPELMKCLIADPGYIFVSSDAGAGEPSVTAHFSQDPNYRYACFDGIGKAPHYRGDVLYIDDIYLMGASVSPVGRDVIRQAWEKQWPAGTFAQQWLADAEIIKKELKTCRQLHKAMILGFSYGMGPRKCVKTLYEQGHIISERDAKAFHTSYWTLMAGVKELSDRLQHMMESDGFIINPFGYRLCCPEPRKAFNAYIQSSVSGLLNVYMVKLLAAAPYAKFDMLIHDELVLRIPDNKFKDMCEARDIAVASLNKDLQWSVGLRFGMVEGRTLYDAK